MTRVYAAGGIFVALLGETGMQSKTARTRGEALDEAASILSRTGMEIVPSRCWPAIASCVSDRDAAVRSSALSCIRSVNRLRHGFELRSFQVRRIDSSAKISGDSWVP